MRLIQQAMLVQDTADNIYTALTSREDLQHWWGLVNPDADGIAVWHGMDRQYAVPIVAAEPGKLLSFAFDSHHPYDPDRVEPTTISFTLAEHGNASMVTVVQSMFTDDDWNTLIHDGWVYSLLSLQLWVERGTPYSQWMNAADFHTVQKALTLPRTAEWAWHSLTHGTVMSQWLSAEVSSDPIVGGATNTLYGDKAVVEGTWILLSEPRNLVHQSGGTIQMWTILPAIDGCIVKFSDYGHDRRRVSNSAIRRLDASWDQKLARLQSLATNED